MTAACPHPSLQPCQQRCQPMLPVPPASSAAFWLPLEESTGRTTTLEGKQGCQAMLTTCVGWPGMVAKPRTGVPLP